MLAWQAKLVAEHIEAIVADPDAFWSKHCSMRPTEITRFLESLVRQQRIERDVHEAEAYEKWAGENKLDPKLPGVVWIYKVLRPWMQETEEAIQSLIEDMERMGKQLLSHSERIPPLERVLNQAP